MKRMDKNPMEKWANRIRRPTGFFPKEVEQKKQRVADYLEFNGVFMRLGHNLTILAISLLSVPAEVFLRYNFGIKYMNPLHMVAGYVFIVGYSELAANYLSNRGQVSHLAWCADVFSYMYIAACVFHALWVIRRNFRRIPCHSEYPGDSLPFWRKMPFYESLGGQATVQYILEPVVLCLLGLLCYLIGSPWVVFFGVCAFALNSKAGWDRDERRERQQEMIDRELEAQRLNQEVAAWRQKKPEHHGPDGVVQPSYVRRRTAEKRRETRARIGLAIFGGIGKMLNRKAANQQTQSDPLPSEEEFPDSEWVEGPNPYSPPPQRPSNNQDPRQMR